MADKQHVRQNIKRLQRVETWQLLILLILAGFIAATFLRLNNIGMADRRDAVLIADKAGDLESTESRLYDLQRYVSTHMNTDTSTFYLEQQYRRDVEKAVKAASEVENPNGSINAQVDAICHQRVSGYSTAYIQCFDQELSKFPAAPDPTAALKLPNSDLYRHEFVAPSWSPDFAGWTLVLCVVIILVIIGRLISLGILHLLLRKHYQNI